MNISMELITSMITTSRNQTKSASDFEQLVNTSKNNKDGDAYYQQHLTDLQQSALTFTSKTNQIKDRSSKEIPACEPMNDKESSPLLMNRLPMQQAQEVPTGVALEPAPTVHQISEPEEYGIAVKKDALTGIALTEGEKKELPTNPADKIQTQPQQTASNDSVIKNHQLYISNNTAELTLNTSQLTKEETRSLEKLIKQWLGNKGLKLKTLIINGVEQ